MSYYNQQQAPPPQSYPPRPDAYPPPAFVAPPPAGYPMKEGSGNPQQVRAETRSRGDGFWKGCCAALCCCCLLDACF